MVWRSRPAPICSFCGADATTAAKLVAGPAVHICDRCIELCNRILAGEPPDSFSREGQSDEALLHSLGPADAAIAAVAALLSEQVDELRRRGVTWQRIGEALGVSRQAVWERFSSKDTRQDP